MCLYGRSFNLVTSLTSRRFFRSSTATWRWTRWITWPSPPLRAAQVNSHCTKCTVIILELYCIVNNSKPVSVVCVCPSLLRWATVKCPSSVRRLAGGVHEGWVLKQVLQDPAGCLPPQNKRSLWVTAAPYSSQNAPVGRWISTLWQILLDSTGLMLFIYSIWNCGTSVSFMLISLDLDRKQKSNK